MYSHINDIIRQVQANLTEDLRTRCKGDPNPFRGYCYVASEVIFHLINHDPDWEPRQLIHEGMSHWYLGNRKTGEIIDATAAQFDRPPDYSTGRRKAFLTRALSRRGKKLMSRLGPIKAR